MNINACVLTAPGINCDRETAYALEVGGGNPERVHINQLLDDPRQLDQFAILALSGGFSHGDHLAAGRLLGLQLRRELAEPLTRFLDAGKIIVGICNGYQVLVESGLLPDGKIDGSDRRVAALAPNQQGGFHCAWKRLVVNQSNCAFAQPEDLGGAIELQVAHGEGNLKLAHDSSYKKLLDDGQVVFQYCDADNQPTEAYPDNPNGSPLGITGICDPSGQILGIMPHPERSVSQQRRHLPFGRTLFEKMVHQAKEL